MKTFTRQGQFEKAVQDAGYTLHAQADQLFAYDGRNLVGYMGYQVECGSVLIETYEEFKILEATVHHPRCM